MLKINENTNSMEIILHGQIWFYYNDCLFGLNDIWSLKFHHNDNTFKQFNIKLKLLKHPASWKS